MLSSNYNSVFTDYLSVTYSPSDNPSHELSSFLCNCGYEVDNRHSNYISKFIFPLDPLRGQLSITSQKNFVSFTCSGKAILYLIKISQWYNLLNLISSFPHKVTRLDIAYDVPRDFTSALRGFRRKYSDRVVSLGRKSQKITEILSPRDPDNVMSGSMYIGKRRDQAHVCVYDKSWELLDRHGIEMPTTTRYELRFKSSVGMTLKDASEPSSLFWVYGHHLLLEKPSGVSEWVSGGDYIGWEHQPEEPLPYERLVKSLDNSTALKSWLISADSIGKEGRNLLKKLLVDRIDSDFDQHNKTQD